MSQPPPVTITISLSVTSSQERSSVTIATDIDGPQLHDQVSITTHIPIASLKLIYRGRLIPKTSTSTSIVEEYKLEEGCVVHCMGKPTALPPSTNITPTDTQFASVPSPTSIPTPNTTPPVASVNTSSPTMQPIDTIESAINLMKARHDPPTYCTGLQTLQKIIDNIIKNPMEEKYRKVKKQNTAFQKRLGRLIGAEAALLSVGFVVTNNESTNLEEYCLNPSPQAWPKLLECKATIDRAVSEAKETVNRTNGADNLHNLSNTDHPNANTTGDSSFLNSTLGSHPDYQQMQQMMSNPQMMQQVQQMMSDPNMMQRMMSDPRIQNNPTLRNQMEMLTRNPQMMQEVSRMMSDPSSRQMMDSLMQNPNMMNNLMNNNAATGNDAMRQQMDLLSQMTQSQQSNTQSRSQSTNRTSESSSSDGNSSSSNDNEMTEEEMIAEAIARSLRES